MDEFIIIIIIIIITFWYLAKHKNDIRECFHIIISI